MKRLNFSVLLVVLLGLIGLGITHYNTKESSVFLTYEVDLKQQNLRFYWKNDQGKLYQNFKTLRAELKKQNESVLFAMNGGMYTKSQSPLGLYVEKGKTLSKLNTVKKAYGNFYLQPNGVFCITKSKRAIICTTPKYKHQKEIDFATQSGPLLLIDGKMNSKFIKGSKNLNVRNGVGILPNGRLLFVMSKIKVNFYDFASYFKSKGCKNALYLDGFVSRTYLPSKQWNQQDGNFGVIIAETELNRK